MTTFWAFTIFTFLTGHGASCGYASSPAYADHDQCDQARQAYEIILLPYQNPQRRISTLECELRVTQPLQHPSRVPR